MFLAALFSKTVIAGPIDLTSLSLTALDGSKIEAEALNNKVVMFVNVASKCGFTPQYEGLQELYTTYQDQGFTVVGVPCNQFGWQEPGNAGEIASFCKLNYGVTFPLLEKQKVNGSDRSDLYKALVNSETGGGKMVKWNFEKFLVGRDGEVVGRFSSKTAPDAAELKQAIEAALKTPEG